MDDWPVAEWTLAVWLIPDIKSLQLSCILKSNPHAFHIAH